MTEATTPTLCGCGCGEPCPPYRGSGPRPKYVNQIHRQRAARAAARAAARRSPQTPADPPKARRPRKTGNATRQPRASTSARARSDQPSNETSAPPDEVTSGRDLSITAWTFGTYTLAPDVTVALIVNAPVELLKPVVDAMAAGYAFGRAGFTASTPAGA